MASPARLRALIDELLAQHEPAIRRAFIEAMQDARDSIVLQDVVDALARGDISAAMQAIEFSRAFLAPLDQAIGSAYFDAGRRYTGLLMAGRPRDVTVEVRFDPGSPRAAGWLREHSSALVTEITEDQRVAVREALGAGMDAGRNPRTVALDLVGRTRRLPETDVVVFREETIRVEWPKGSRTGGIVGLTSREAQTVENVRQRLMSGDPAEMREYLGLKTRDKRFDRTVMKAIKDRRPVAAPDVRRIVEKYTDRALIVRGRRIARTESLTALSHAQNEANEQLIAASGLRRDQIVRTWRSRADGRTRDTHVAMSGQVRAMDEAFDSPSGARLMFPRDDRAPSSETILCRCYLTTSVRW